MAALAREASNGDENAFNELYHLTRDRAYFVAYTITHSEQDALDILQESYLKAWQKCGALEKPAVFGAWLHQIVGNTAKDFVKKRRPQLFEPLDEEVDPLALLPEEDAAYIPDAAMDTAETKRLIMEIIDRLPEDQRLCVLLYYYDDMPVASIAQSLELPVSTVKNRLAYARRKISSGVEQLEKSGKIKLFGISPTSLLAWLLRNVAVESSKQLPPVILGGSAAVGGSAAGGAAGGILAASVLPKVIAGIAAVVTLTGSALAVTKALSDRPQPPEEFISAATIAAEDARTYNAEGYIAGPEPFFFPTLPAIEKRQTQPYSQPSRKNIGTPAALPATTGAGAAETTPITSTIPATTTAVATTTVRTTTEYIYTAPSTTSTATTTTTRATSTAPIAITSASTTTTTTTTTIPGPIKTPIGDDVFLAYLSETLPDGAVFQVSSGGGFTSRIVDRQTDTVIANFILSCRVDGVLLHEFPEGVTIYLPVPTQALPDIDRLEVQHQTRVFPPRIETMPIRVEDGYLVFETTYI